MENLNISTKNNDGHTAFTLACSKYHTNIISLLMMVPNIDVNIGFLYLFKHCLEGITEI